MKYNLEEIEQRLARLHDGSQMETCCLCRGIELSYLILKTDQLTLPHDPLKHILEINYCRAGRMGWKMEN